MNSMSSLICNNTTAAWGDLCRCVKAAGHPGHHDDCDGTTWYEVQQVTKSDGKQTLSPVKPVTQAAPVSPDLLKIADELQNALGDGQSLAQEYREILRILTKHFAVTLMPSSKETP